MFIYVLRKNDQNTIYTFCQALASNIRRHSRGCFPWRKEVVFGNKQPWLRRGFTHICRHWGITASCMFFSKPSFTIISPSSFHIFPIHHVHEPRLHLFFMILRHLPIALGMSFGDGQTQKACAADDQMHLESRRSLAVSSDSSDFPSNCWN